MTEEQQRLLIVGCRTTAKWGKLSDDALRALWGSFGGSFHGPIVEHASMPEEKLLPFLRMLLSDEP